VKKNKMPSDFHTTRRIEFPDTDMAGIVHFSRFFVFMEAAEHEFLRTLGTSVSTEWEGNIIGWPRLEASCEYFSPIKFEDVLDIYLSVLRKGTKSMTYQFNFSLGETAVARGKLSTICCICNPGEEIRSIPIPDFIASQIEQAPQEEVTDGAEG